MVEPRAVTENEWYAHWWTLMAMMAATPRKRTTEQHEDLLAAAAIELADVSRDDLVAMVLFTVGHGVECEVKVRLAEEGVPADGDSYAVERDCLCRMYGSIAERFRLEVALENSEGAAST